MTKSNVNVRGEVYKALMKNNNEDFIVDECVYIRTITFHLTGRIFKVTDKFIFLEEAAWIADSGRFTQAINDGVLDEVEPVNVPVRVSINSIVDVYSWTHALPKEQK